MKENYEDYSSGRVLYGVTGATNFSVRITNEIFEWCEEYFVSKNKKAPYVVYDPFCGIAYSMTVLGFLHVSKIDTIFASDIDEKMVEFANKNLSLLSSEGINLRIQELQAFVKEYNKDSHREALESAFRLKANIADDIKTKVFQLNILNTNDIPKEITNLDFVFADVPYGQLTEWKGLNDTENPIQLFLNNIKDRLADNALVAIVLNKKQDISYDGYVKIKSFSRGTRKVIILGAN